MRKPLTVIIVTLSVVCIKGLVNTKEQSNACMCAMMSKGSKEALTVLIVTHITHVKRVESGVCCFYLCNTIYRVMLLILLMLKGLITFLLITFIIFNRFSM